MIYVRKEDERVPFSRGILARSLAPTGLPVETLYTLVKELQKELRTEGITIIESGDLQKRICGKLREKGYGSLEKYYTASRQLSKLKKPVIILIGGASGVGKSAVSTEICRRYGIDRFIGTDIIREIMRYMMPQEINPALHESSFTEKSSVPVPTVEDQVIYNFHEQSRIVCEGVDACIRRIVTEGLKTVINGVHLFPGLLAPGKKWSNPGYQFQYVLYIEDEKEHQERFRMREASSSRGSANYIHNITNIRRIQEYYLRAAQQEKVMAVENSDFENAVDTIFKDITRRLGRGVFKKERS